MSEEKQKIERAEKFINDYEKLLAQPDLSTEMKKRAIEDVDALKEVLDYANRYVDLI